MVSSSSSSCSSDDNEDELLMRAASTWAAKNSANDEEIKTKGPVAHRKSDKRQQQLPPNTTVAKKSVASSIQKEEKGSKFAPDASPAKKLSVHVTQISFEATIRDLRTHFHTPIVRMVKKQGEFTGVAFCDYEDTALYERALALHRTSWLGRAINVRPVRTPEELQLIVLRRGQAKDAERLKRKPNTTNTKERDANAAKKKQRKNRKAAIIHSRQHQKRK